MERLEQGAAMIGTRLASPNLWRLLAAVVVAFGLLLPISKCSGPSGDEYSYVYEGVASRHQECRSPKNPTPRWQCELGEAAVDGLLVVRFFWPAAGWAVAIRERRRVTTAVRLIVEPVLLAISFYLLLAILVANDAASGWYVETAGFAMYFAAWAIEMLKRLLALVPAGSAGTP